LVYHMEILHRKVPRTSSIPWCGIEPLACSQVQEITIREGWGIKPVESLISPVTLPLTLIRTLGHREYISWAARIGKIIEGKEYLSFYHFISGKPKIGEPKILAQFKGGLHLIYICYTCRYSVAISGNTTRVIRYIILEYLLAVVNEVMNEVVMVWLCLRMLMLTQHQSFQ